MSVNPLPVVPIPTHILHYELSHSCVCCSITSATSISYSLTSWANSKSIVTVADALAVLPGVPLIVLVCLPLEQLIIEHVTREWQD
jgi:hypothetical protein